MDIEKLKKRCGYDGKPQQFKYGFDLACRELVNTVEQAAKAQAVPECKWTQNEDGYFDASCGKSFVFSEPEDKPSEHQFKHCCYCGGKLVEAREQAND